MYGFNSGIVSRKINLNSDFFSSYYNKTQGSDSKKQSFVTGSASGSFVDEKGNKSMVSTGGSGLKLGIDHNKLMGAGK